MNHYPRVRSLYICCMRKQDQLIALIHSLSQGEKKHFVQRSKAGDTSRSYLKLYELLLKTKEYNADELCRQLGKNKTTLANEKKYLQKNLLSSLLQYHQDHPQLSTLNRIAEATVLMERNLPEMASASLKQAIKASGEAQMQPMAWHAHGLMLTLCSDPFMSFDEGKQQAGMHLQAMQSLAEHIQLATAFELLSDKVFAAYHSRRLDLTEEHKNETRALLAHPLLNADYNVFQFVNYKYSLQMLLYARLKDTESNVLTNEKIIALYETQPQIDTVGYWNAIANLTQALILAGNAKKYTAWMEKLRSRYYKKLPVDDSYITRMLDQHKSVFNSGAYFRFLYNGTVATSTIRSFVGYIKNEYRSEKRKVPSYHFTSIIYKTAACSLVVNDPHTAIELINKLLNEEEGNSNPASLKYLRMLFMMAHAQLGNVLLLPTLQKSLVNRDKNATTPTELQFLRSLSELAGSTSPKQRLLWFQNTYKRFTNANSDVETQRLLEAIPILQWAGNNIR